LDQVGGHRSEKEIARYIRDPKSVDPNAKMPPQKELSARELEEVAKFLSSLK
jgi:nitric oxide reductase subunit C